jgi:hypothetical protein
LLRQRATDLDAHYAQLLAEEENATSVADPVIAKTESSPADSPGIGTGTMDDEDDEEMEAVDIKQDASGEIESLRNAIVKGKQADVTVMDLSVSTKNLLLLSRGARYAVWRCYRRGSREDVF